MKWSVVYKKCYNEDGSLFFPEKLTEEFLASAKKTMGSYLFANQYDNEVFPSDEQVFRPEWLRYYKELPEKTHTFAFIDPAISVKDGADYTALTVVDVDCDMNWYLRVANRYRITPPKIIDLIFRVNEEFKPRAIGLETVAYQEALVYMLQEEMQKRQKLVPLASIKTGNDKTKEMRILGLVPRFEFGRIFLNTGLYEFETEMMQFPRGSHDDILDSLSQHETIIYYPTKEEDNHEPASANDPRFEKFVIERYIQRANEELDGD